MAIVFNGATRHRVPTLEMELFVRTVGLPAAIDPRTRIPARPSAVWLHGPNGAIALGETIRCEARGVDRFRELAADFSALTARAHVVDDVRTRGTGLTAFGSFSYSAMDERASRLIVPELMLGTRDGESFLTFVSTSPIPHIDDADIAEALARFTPAPRSAPLTVSPVSAHTDAEYEALVSEATRRIEAGEVHKVIVSERFTIDLGSVPARRLIPGIVRRLNARYPGAWTFHLDDIVGASPEMLVRTRGRTVSSRVLAGTRAIPNGGSLTSEERSAFLADDKERREHAYAVRSVVEPLSALTSHLTHSPTPFVLSLPGLEHLASDVFATLNPHVHNLDVLHALHPSAAVSGTPREAANALIDELEDERRGGYASPVGWINGGGDGEWAIALRMAHIHDNALTLQAGGGLVSGSVPHRERAESLAKARPVLDALS